MLLVLAMLAVTYAHPEQLVETDWVAAHAKDANVRIVDMRMNGFAEGHVPGSVYLSPVAIRDANSPPTFLPTPAAFEAMMAKLGIGDSTRVVVYDERGGIYAARLWWILNYFGHSNVALMNGGWIKWTAEHRATAADAAAPPAARFTAKPQPKWIAVAADVVGAIDKPGVKIIDARTVAEIEGRELRNIKRGGFVPSSIPVYWEELLDRLIMIRGEGLNIGFTIQVDTLCHKIPNFIEKATAAGVRRVFIGLENINPDNLLAANKRQNKITEYRIMLQKWRTHGALTYAGYIIGFPGDTKESIKRDVEIIKRELPLDILEFFFLTPLPGSEDHKVMWGKGAWMDPDMNKYDLNHRVAHHPKMSDAEWEEAYKTAWETYYTPEHIRTILQQLTQKGVTSLVFDLRGNGGGLLTHARPPSPTEVLEVRVGLVLGHPAPRPRSEQLV